MQIMHAQMVLIIDLGITALRKKIFCSTYLKFN